MRKQLLQELKLLCDDLKEKQQKTNCKREMSGLLKKS